MKISWNTAFVAATLWSFSSLVQPAAMAQPAAPPAPPAPPAPSAARYLPGSGSYLGIGIQEITGDRAKALGLKEEGGVEITRVSPDSPAERAGLKAGDVLLTYNGTKIDGIEQLSRLVRETPVGRDVKIELWRNGSAQTVTARIGQHPLPGLPEGFNWRMPDIPRMIQGMRSPLLGIEAESIDGQLAQYFGVSDGVLVRSVMKGSLAEKAGIKAGDVITRVDDARVTSAADISNRLRTARGKTVSIALMRDHKETSVNIEVPDVRPAFGRTEPARFVTVERP
jgi:serine protease Do